MTNWMICNPRFMEESPGDAAAVPDVAAVAATVNAALAAAVAAATGIKCPPPSPKKQYKDNATCLCNVTLYQSPPGSL